jgi:ABC-type sugar transport system substrate-binding protein
VGDLGTANEEAGWIAVDAAARVIAGEELPETLPISSVLLTKKNIGEYPDHFEGVAGYQKQFEEEWGG